MRTFVAANDDEVSSAVTGSGPSRPSPPSRARSMTRSPGARVASREPAERIPARSASCSSHPSGRARHCASALLHKDRSATRQALDGLSPRQPASAMQGRHPSLIRSLIHIRPAPFGVHHAAHAARLRTLANFAGLRRAYLESVLGATPQEFESPILRHSELRKRDHSAS